MRRQVASVAVLLIAGGCAPGVSGGTPLTTSTTLGRAAANPPTDLQVWWAKDLQLKALGDATEALGKPDPVGFGELSKADDVRIPNNCREWAALHAGGYDPTTTVEIQADDGARVCCGTLELLARVHQAAVSYVRALSFEGPNVLSVLPAELATAVSDDEYERRQQATTGRATLADYDPRARVTQRSDTSLEILEGGGTRVILLQKQALGDFDGDGIEDLVVSVVNAMTRGTLSSTRLLVFTRKAAVGPLELISRLGTQRANAAP